MIRVSVAAVAVLAVTGCTGGSADGPDSQPTLQLPTRPTPSACPAVHGSRAFAWPTEVPKDLPQPPGAVFEKTTRTPEGLTIVRFPTPTTRQESVLFVVRQVQKAGFQLGRGDAEPLEADAPFGRDDLRGVYKMLLHADCRTDWLVAVTKARPTDTSPLLPTPTGMPGQQPLPFG
jgi:hypothetical protein